MTATDLVRPEDLAIDHELADIAASIPLLLYVTPNNLIEARRRFLEDRSAPKFTYGTLEDPAVVEARLAAATIDAVEDPALSHLLQAKHRELELQVEMLRQRDTDEFLGLSIQLYGTVSPALVGDAESLLNRLVISPTEPGPRLDAAAFALRVEAELDHYRARHAGLEVVVEIRRDSSGVMVSNGNVLIAPTVVGARSEGPHPAAARGRYARRHARERFEPAPSTTRRRTRRLRRNPGRSGGVRRVPRRRADGEETASIGRTGRRRSSDGRWRIVPDGSRRARRLWRRRQRSIHHHCRVFRSGGLTKDAVYLRGLRGIISHLGAGGVLDGLWLGKLSLTDLPHINDLRDRGILHDPVLVPRYLDDPAAQQRLANVTASTTPVDLLPETVRDHELIGGPR